MEDVIQDRPGIFTRIRSVFSREEIEEGESLYDESNDGRRPVVYRREGSYVITVRRQIESFQDAVAAADGLKRGEQQILNLSRVDSALREKIKDFMSGVNYAEEGHWEEIGENMFLLAPPTALVEVAPASARMQAAQN